MPALEGLAVTYEAPLPTPDPINANKDCQKGSLAACKHLYTLSLTAVPWRDAGMAIDGLCGMTQLHTLSLDLMANCKGLGVLTLLPHLGNLSVARLPGPDDGVRFTSVRNLQDLVDQADSSIPHGPTTASMYQGVDLHALDAFPSLQHVESVALIGAHYLPRLWAAVQCFASSTSGWNLHFSARHVSPATIQEQLRPGCMATLRHVIITDVTFRKEWDILTALLAAAPSISALILRMTYICSQAQCLSCFSRWSMRHT